MKIDFAIDEGEMSTVFRPRVLSMNDPEVHSDSSLYNCVKLIEKNKLFNTFVQKCRQDAGIPHQGFTVSEYLKNRQDEIDYFDGLHKLPRPENIKAVKGYKAPHLFREIRRYEDMLGSYDIDFRIKKQFMNIVCANFVVLSTILDIHENEDDIGLVAAIFIRKKISMTEFIKEVRRSWPYIESILDTLPPRKDNFVSKKDWRTFELRTEYNAKFKDIPDIVTDELNLDNQEGRINESSTRKAFHDLKEKIDSAFSKRE